MYVRGNGNGQLDGWLPDVLRWRLPGRDLDRGHDPRDGGRRVEDVPGAGVRRRRGARRTATSRTRRRRRRRPSREPTTGRTPTRAADGADRRRRRAADADASRPPTPTEPTPTPDRRPRLRSATPTEPTRPTDAGAADGDGADGRRRRRRRLARRPAAPRRPSGQASVSAAAGDARAAHVHPTQDDPVVAALSEGVGGPVGEHAGAAPVVDAGAGGAAADRDHASRSAWCRRRRASPASRPGPAVPLHAHVLLRPAAALHRRAAWPSSSWPYSDDEEARDRYEVMEYPVGISYWACGAAWVTHVLNGVARPRRPRYRQPGRRASPAATTCDARCAIFVLVNARRLRRAGAAGGVAAGRGQPAAALGRRGLRALAGAGR